MAEMRDPRVILVTGDKGSGKTSSLMDVIRWAGERSIPTSGIISPRYFDETDMAGYDALDCRSGKNFELARKPVYAKGNDWVRFGGMGYVFSRTGLDRANRILADAARNRDGLEILVVDEVGRLEMMGEGLAPGLEEVLSSVAGRPRIAIISCRLEAIDMARRKAVEHGFRAKVWSPGDVPGLTEILDSLNWQV